MKKLKLSIIFILLFVFAAFTRQATAQDNTDKWIGKYEFNYSEPAQRGQYAPVITYTFFITKKGQSLIARFTAEGTQANDNYECRVEVKNNRLNFFVVRDLVQPPEKSMTTLKKGDLLASLRTVVVKGKTKYLFSNGGYEIFPPETAARYPVYFAKKR